ncbi:MAG: cellulose biosynthesis cyclic di-GMP-binding regulatory protein BcsB [Pseudomonadaceae bacterium]|nr:cellulose biosynthesis cyclic di-GMP-binding regulatory protein BcsB [Pseudomonadaceae bacterium]
MSHKTIKMSSLRHPRVTFLLAALLASCSINLLAAEKALKTAEAEIAVVESPLLEPAVIVPVEGARTSTYTLKQLGVNEPMNLRGIEGSDSVNFDVRADQVVTAARLTLEYTYSPAMISELSNINVLINDEVVVSLALPKEVAGTPQKQVVEIPSHLITDFNRLTLQLIGHYTMQCEDPLHSSLWANISNNSVLEIQGTQFVLPDDLAKLPLPLFDRRDSSALNLPFVFSGSWDNNQTLEAAGAISSWFGALAGYRGATFPVSQNQLPEKGNAVVLLSGADSQSLLGAEFPAVTGPTVMILSNPNDQFGKLLVVAGRDAAELKLAAAALVTGSDTLTGQRVVVDKLDTLLPRKPYDAPNWLPSDRPVKLGELLPAKKLSVSGYGPRSIIVPLRVAPDLFSWREKGLPLKLKYRYTPQPISTNSSLLVHMNNKFVKSEPLPSIERLGASEELLAMLQKDDSLIKETELLLPLDTQSPKPEMQFRYMYDYIKQGDCRDIIIDNMRGAIEPDSTIDVSGYDHFIALPELSVFSTSGFPFTRLADLAETAVIMPDTFGPAEVSAYLTVLGRFGESTGFPATAVTVAQARQVLDFDDKDLLVLSSGTNQPLLKDWADSLPASLEGKQQRFEVSDLLFSMRNWISTDPQANIRQARSSLSFAGDGNINYLAGFESPLQSGRSVVVLASDRPEGLNEVAAALIGGAGYDQPIQGSLAVLRGKSISSVVAEESYFSGSLSLFKYLQWMLSRHFALMVFFTALATLCLVSLLFVSLRARAKRRLD